MTTDATTPALRRPYLDDGDVRVYAGDCIEVMAELPAESVDAVACDPPYGLEFMGREWDAPWKGTASAHIAHERRAAETTDENKRRYIRAAVNAYEAGRPFQEWCQAWAEQALRVLKPGGHLIAFGGTRTFHRLTCGLEDAGFEIRDCLSWLYGQGFPKSLNLDGDHAGLGTALKPGWEPAVLARKPLTGTVAANVQAHGTGALNIDGCRIGTHGARSNGGNGKSGTAAFGDYGPTPRVDYDTGRWPANVVLDEAAARILDEQAPSAGGGFGVNTGKPSRVYGDYAGLGGEVIGYGDAGGASRFFYTSKASTAERNNGHGPANTHPTVKPVDLMRWLVRLVTPPGGLVLDPFAGSGTTGVACREEGFRCVLIEREAEYLGIIAGRLSQLSLFGDAA